MSSRRAAAAVGAPLDGESFVAGGVERSEDGGWSFDRSRQLVADVDLDGDDDLCPAQRASTGQFRIWTHTSTRTAFQAPTLYRDVLAGYDNDGAQFATSRH